jgi:hypothetical protein
MLLQNDCYRSRCKLNIKHLLNIICIYIHTIETEYWSNILLQHIICTWIWHKKIIAVQSSSYSCCVFVGTFFIFCLLYCANMEKEENCFFLPRTDIEFLQNMYAFYNRFSSIWIELFVRWSRLLWLSIWNYLTFCDGVVVFVLLLDGWIKRGRDKISARDPNVLHTDEKLKD